VIETRFPIRVERHELLPKMAGAGRFRAGAGVARDFRMLEGGIRMQFTVENVRDTLAKGLGGGRDGEPGYLVASPGTSREEMLPRNSSRYSSSAARPQRLRTSSSASFASPVSRAIASART
jgi:N-methylhydantoinase B